MLKRLVVLAFVALVALLPSISQAADRQAFEAGAFETALKAGKPILVHVTAPWCGECKLQKPIVAKFADAARFAGMTIFEVDFDSQKDALRSLRVQKQSTLVVFKDQVEVSRAVGITRANAIEELMTKAL